MVVIELEVSQWSVPPASPGDEASMPVSGTSFLIEAHLDIK